MPEDKQLPQETIAMVSKQIAKVIDVFLYGQGGQGNSIHSTSIGTLVNVYFRKLSPQAIGAGPLIKEFQTSLQNKS